MKALMKPSATPLNGFIYCFHCILVNPANRKQCLLFKLMEVKLHDSVVSVICVMIRK